MKKLNTNSKQGFTIIEVVLVLAIAGLIFLMVFIALPTLQRSQRDTRRQEDFSRFLSQIQAYQKNNRNNIPGTPGNSTWEDFIKRYLEVDGDSFADPDGEKYKPLQVSCGGAGTDNVCATGSANLASDPNTTFPNDHTLYIVTSAVCNGEKAVSSSGSRKVAILYKYENGGVYCNNN